MTALTKTFPYQPELTRQSILTKEENYSFDMRPTYRIHELLKDTIWVTSPYSIYLFVKETNDLLWHEQFAYTIEGDETHSLDQKVRFLKDDNDEFGESNVEFWMDLIDQGPDVVGRRMVPTKWAMLKDPNPALNCEARTMMDELLGYCFIYRERLEKENAEFMAELEDKFPELKN